MSIVSFMHLSIVSIDRICKFTGKRFAKRHKFCFFGSDPTSKHEKTRRFLYNIKIIQINAQISKALRQWFLHHSTFWKPRIPRNRRETVWLYIHNNYASFLCESSVFWIKIRSSFYNRIYSYSNIGTKVRKSLCCRKVRCLFFTKSDFDYQSGLLLCQKALIPAFSAPDAEFSVPAGWSCKFRARWYHFPAGSACKTALFPAEAPPEAILPLTASRVRRFFHWQIAVFVL